MRDLRLQLDVNTQEMNNNLLAMKNELQNKTATALDQIQMVAEEAKEDLRVKEGVLNASLQQGQSAVVGGRGREVGTCPNTLSHRQNCS